MAMDNLYGPRDEGHSSDAAMLFAVSAAPSYYAAVEAEVKLDLDYRSELFDAWMSALAAPSTAPAGELARTTSMSAVAERITSEGRPLGEVDAWAKASAEMYCSYVEGLT